MMSSCTLALDYQPEAADSPLWPQSWPSLSLVPRLLVGGSLGTKLAEPELHVTHTHTHTPHVLRSFNKNVSFNGLCAPFMTAFQLVLVIHDGENAKPWWPAHNHEHNQQLIVLVIYGKVHMQISCMFIFLLGFYLQHTKRLDHKLELGKAWKWG